jgi:Family of unknown function (DUF6328)
VERDVDDVASDAGWDQQARSETETERLDRNWGDLLQELRVVQTGVQLLTGLLLTVPFQARFGELTGFQRAIYLATVAVAVTSTALLIAPVALHRLLFRQHARRSLVAISQRFAVGGLALLGLAVIGVVVLIFDVVTGLGGAVAAAVASLVVFGSLWVVVPLHQRHRARLGRR